MTQSTSRKFLETLEEVILSSRTSPVVKERLLQVLAAAAYASSSSTYSVLSAVFHLYSVVIRSYRT